MATPCEFTLAEKPCLDYLQELGYKILPANQNEAARDGLNQVLLRDTLIQAIQELNQVPKEVARATYHELLTVSDNEKWTSLLRGNYSRTVPGESRKKTIHLIDFLHPERNTFTVTNQFTVQAQKTRKPDLVVFVNGVPLVVIECKSPLSAKSKQGEAFEQIKQYEQDVPRLFYSNLLSIITDGTWTLYGATGAPSEFWATWKDPWPRKRADFQDDLQSSLWSLLEPSRLLDLLAHFVVFEKRDQKVTKKVCRYQQFRAVNKIVDRVVGEEDRRGLIWHTQGSGKSLTMVFAAMKLKSHRTLEAPTLTSPNLLVLTDRIDLDDQISKTFEACQLPNPRHVTSIQEFQSTLSQGTSGLTVLSTIFKFEKSRDPLPDSQNWIVLVDECHRTQEKDLGAYLRATLPEARFFGFTGTPIKTTDKDTYRNFGAPGEFYLDKYSIDDAVADGATVPIRYTGRRTEWHLEGEKLDILFDQWFADEDEDTLERIKAQGARFATLAKHSKRVGLIAYDIWTHFKEYIQPDGYKAQIVGIDREALVLYKRALDQVITDDLIKHQGLSPEEARVEAETMSACVYSSNQEDGKPAEDEYKDGIRQDLRKYLVEGAAEKAVIQRFQDPKAPLQFLIVCNKLLTGFDAPIEQVMYLDNPLKEHNLLQAIARTNRVSGRQKQYGLIVDYIGITKRLDEALESYRNEDVQSALQDLQELQGELKAAHAEVLEMIKGVPRGSTNVKAEYNVLIQALGTEDMWFTFRRKARAFIRAYEALSPDPFVLDYTEDMKWVAGFLPVATQKFEKEEGTSLKDYSAKIREMLEEHLDVTGIRTVCKLRTLTDPDYWSDFDTEKKPEEELKTAAIRKATELKKILREKMAENPLRYGPFSEMIREIIRRFEEGIDDASESLRRSEALSKDLTEEEQAHQGSGLSRRAYDILKILESFQEGLVLGEPSGTYGFGSEEGHGNSPLVVLARDIDELYASDQHAPLNWHTKTQTQKELRQEVRKLANRAGFKGKNLKVIPIEVQKFALDAYRKIG